MKRKNICITLAVLVGVIIVIFFLRRRDRPDNSALLPTRTVPDIALQYPQGGEVRLSDFRGKFLLVNTWASWCPFCLKELPDFISLKKEYGDDFMILAVNRGEKSEIVKKYTEDLKLGNTLTVLLDPNDALYKEIGGFSMPETIFVDTEGMIREHKRGPMTLEEMRRRIKDVFGI